VTTPAPSGDAVDNLWLGILLDPQQATVIHDLGPYGGSAEVFIVIFIIKNIPCRVYNITTSAALYAVREKPNLKRNVFSMTMDLTATGV